MDITLEIISDTQNVHIQQQKAEGDIKWLWYKNTILEAGVTEQIYLLEHTHPIRVGVQHILVTSPAAYYCTL